MKRFCPLRILRKKLLSTRQRSEMFPHELLDWKYSQSGVEVSPSQHIRELSMVTCGWYEKLWPKFCQRGIVEKTVKQWGLDRWQHNVLVSLYSHDAFTRRLTQPAFWTCVQDIFRGKSSPFGSLRAWQGRPSRGALSRADLWSDPDAAGVWKGTAQERGGFTAALIDRGQDQVRSHISWLWSLFLSHFLSS